MHRHVLFIIIILFFFVFAGELAAPETTERDIYGYAGYRIEDSGAIVDGEGAIKGWVHADVIYDAQWNERYRIQKGASYRIEDVGG